MILSATRKARKRPGVTMMESTLILLVFATLVLGMIDLGSAVMEMHLLTDAARQVARQAKVRGGLADALGQWGPDTVGPVTAGGPHAACTTLRESLPGIDPESVTMVLEWPDGGNDEGMRVRVSLGASRALLMPRLWGGGTITLSATSVTPISH